MYIDDVLNEHKNEKIKIYVDMDGVIADYEVGKACEYDKKRPLISNIEKLKEISKNENIELFILSITRYDTGFKEKNTWLEEFAPFFKEENRNIISRESNDFKHSDELKSEFVKKLPRNKLIIVIDDDPIVLKRIYEENEDVILLKDTALVK